MEWDWSGRFLTRPPPQPQSQHTGVCLEEEKLKQCPALPLPPPLSVYLNNLYGGASESNNSPSRRMQLKMGNTDFICKTQREKEKKIKKKHWNNVWTEILEFRPILFSYLKTRWKKFSSRGFYSSQVLHFNLQLWAKGNRRLDLI